METAETEWVIQIDKELKRNESSVIIEAEKWKKHSIYEIPSRIADLNKEAYKPQTVSFGPYHYGKEHLKGMEEHKHRAFVHFLKRCGKPLKTLLQSMGDVEQDLRDTYKPLRWKERTIRRDYYENDNRHEFLRMMILDGCFILEVLRTEEYVLGGNEYADNDPVFSSHGRLYVMPYIKRDMLMLENQLPMVVLDKLIEFEGRKIQDEDFLNKLILNFFGTSHNKSFGKALHILDLYRKSLLHYDEPSKPKRHPKTQKHNNNMCANDNIIMRSARELQEAGIRFRCSKTRSLRDVSFDDGFLRLPTMVIDDSTEPSLLNLLAFERLHVGAGNDVSSYLFFMDSIIDREIDVAILHQKQILVNAIGSDKAVAKLFNSLTRDLTVDREGELDKVQVDVWRYSRKPRNRWRATLIEMYFRNPWAIVSLIAAIVLFALTIIQTAYTIKQSYNNADNSTPTSAPPRFPPRRA